MVYCEKCEKEITDESHEHIFKIRGKTYHFCGLDCIYHSEQFEASGTGT